MCFKTAKWKREAVKDHKFDFVYIEDFRKNKTIIRLKYVYLYLVVIKTILVYIVDLWNAGILIIFDRWSSVISPNKHIFFVAKWIYVSCIAMSFLLLALDWKKARAIIASRDISYAFTSIIASRYYTLKSYSHFCFFHQINKQKRIVDKIAFFVFFTFKGWKRILFAEAPRQAINVVTLYSIVQSKKDVIDLDEYSRYDTLEKLAMILLTFTLLVFIVSATKLAFSFIVYIPLLFHIRGNLKEYCCHKIDKRIDELLKKKALNRRKQQKTIQKAVEKGNIKGLKKKDKKLLLVNSKRKQPTLPVLNDVHNNNNIERRPPSPHMFNHSNGSNSQISPLVINRPSPYESQINNRPTRQNNPYESQINNNRPTRQNGPYEFPISPEFAYNSSEYHPSRNLSPPIVVSPCTHTNSPVIVPSRNPRLIQRPPCTNSPRSLSPVSSSSSRANSRAHSPEPRMLSPHTNYLRSPSPHNPSLHANSPELVHNSHVRYQPPLHTRGRGGPQYFSQNERFNDNYYYQ